MLDRNWIELIIIAAIFLIGSITKYITKNKLKRLDGYKSINDLGEGHGWKVQ